MRRSSSDYDEKKRQSEERMLATPDAHPDAVQGDASLDVQIAQCLDLFAERLESIEVESIFKLTDHAVQTLTMHPTFTYGDVAQAVDADERFALAKRQLCCLAGGDPVKLYVKRLGF